MSEFAELARAFLDETFADHPVSASQLGVEGFDDQLDDLSENAFEDRRRRSAAWLTRFEQLPATACATFDEHLDRELLLSVLRGRAIMDDWLIWRRQPELYVTPGLSGVFTLFLNRLHPEPELARSAIARLRAVPRVLEEGRGNIRPELAPAVYVDRAVRQARAGSRYARDVVANEVKDPRLRA